MEAIFDRETWEEYVKGYSIYDCTFNRPQAILLLLVERKGDRDTYPRTRLLFIYPEDPVEERFGYFELGEMTFATVARGINPPEYIAVDIGSIVYSANRQRDGLERKIEEVADMRVYKDRMATIGRVVRVAGHVYAVGSDRKIYRRVGMDQWIDLSAEGKGCPTPAELGEGVSKLSLGFKDMCAFDANDMYAVGGHGDVWRFDGTQWHNCPFPTNDTLETVACGEDGKVYISDMKGNVWAGRENRWALVAEAEFAWGSQPVDSAWFKGRLYLGSQDGLYTLGERKTVVPVESVFDGAPRMGNCGRVDVSPDGQFMLTAGSFGATLFDGETWTKLFSSYDFM